MKNTLNSAVFKTSKAQVNQVIFCEDLQNIVRLSTAALPEWNSMIYGFILMPVLPKPTFLASFPQDKSGAETINLRSYNFLCYSFTLRRLLKKMFMVTLDDVLLCER
jgi:hypothetical protein